MKYIKAITCQLRQLLPTLAYTTVLHQINLAVPCRIKSIVKHYERKLTKFRLQYHTQSDTNHMEVNKHIIHNFSSYVLSPEEITALSFGLDQHILCNVDNNSINTELELFYQNLLQDNSHLPQHTLSRIKTKVRYTCEKYCNIKTPYKYQKVIQNLRENQSIIILKSDKEHGVIIMNQNAYTDKYFSILNSSQFTQLNHDPTNKSERKLQRVIRKVKLKLLSNIYPSVSCPAKFY